MNKKSKPNKQSSTSDSSSYNSTSLSESNKSITKKSKKLRNSSPDISSATDNSRKGNGRKKNKNDRCDSCSDSAKKKKKTTKKPNPYKGITIDYNEPPEAKQPNKRWRLCPVKHSKSLQAHEKSAYLIGRLRKIVDIPINHPTCSKQHAALQYRLVNVKKNDGTFSKSIRPYIIDLDSVNGTYVNNKKITPRKYVELHEKDIIKFGNCLVEYVLLFENTGNKDQDDDIQEVDSVTVKKECNN